MEWTLRFNRSLKIEARRERMTGDAGAVTGREVLRRSGVVRWMAKRLADARDTRRIRHTMTELLRTALLLAAQCRRDHNDAGVFRDDPAFRLGVSDRSGTAPLDRGLASQPTLSRLVAALGKKRNAEVLRGGLARFAGWRLRVMNGGRLPKRLVIDLDSLRRRSTANSRAASGTATTTPASTIPWWRRRVRRGTSSMSGSATARPTRRRAAWSSSSRCWTGRNGFSARRPRSASTPAIPGRRSWRRSRPGTRTMSPACATTRC